MYYDDAVVLGDLRGVKEAKAAKNNARGRVI